jgi:hypothetical protein
MCQNVFFQWIHMNFIDICQSYFSSSKRLNRFYRYVRHVLYRLEQDKHEYLSIYCCQSLIEFIDSHSTLSTDHQQRTIQIEIDNKRSKSNRLIYFYQKRKKKQTNNEEKEKTQTMMLRRTWECHSYIYYKVTKCNVIDEKCKHRYLTIERKTT